MNSEEYGELRMHKYMVFCVKSDKLYPQVVYVGSWLCVETTAARLYQFEQGLSNVFQAPSSTAAVERYHSIKKQVISKLGSRMTDGKKEKLVFIANNFNSL